jgi:hypothetical protein
MGIKHTGACEFCRKTGIIEEQGNGTWACEDCDGREPERKNDFVEGAKIVILLLLLFGFIGAIGAAGIGFDYLHKRLDMDLKSRQIASPDISEGGGDGKRIDVYQPDISKTEIPPYLPPDAKMIFEANDEVDHCGETDPDLLYELEENTLHWTEGKKAHISAFPLKKRLLMFEQVIKRVLDRTDLTIEEKHKSLREIACEIGCSAKDVK